MMHVPAVVVGPKTMRFESFRCFRSRCEAVTMPDGSFNWCAMAADWCLLAAVSTPWFFGLENS